MAEAAQPGVRAWPRPLSAALLVVFVLAQGALWGPGFYFLFERDLERSGAFLTGALFVMLLGGWAWRWFVARGWIGGRATARFGGS